MRLRFIQKVIEAFVHNQKHAARRAPLENAQQQRGRCRPPGRIVWLTQKYHVQCGRDRLQNFLRNNEAVFLAQVKVLRAAVRKPECLLVFRKGRRRNQRALRADSQNQPENQVCRAVAAEHGIHRQLVPRAKRRRKRAAQRVGIAVGRRKRRADGAPHAVRKP